MKKYVAVLLLVAVLFLLAACTLDPFEEYENFIMDMDINARIEDALTGVKNGDTSSFFESSVEAIYYDLQNFNENDYQSGILQQPIQEDYTAGDINNYYIDCVTLMTYAIDENREGNTQKAKLYYDQAMDKYVGAQKLYQQFLVEYGRENDYSY